MAFEEAIAAVAADAMRFVNAGDTIGLGSGRAATAFVRALGKRVRTDGLDVRGIPTSMQIRLVAEDAGVPLIDAGQAASIDAAFDGADQIDARGNMVKGGGGALLREKILISAARRVIIMADRTKFSRHLSIPVPVEVHASARSHVASRVERLGGAPSIRRDARGYPAFTENGNIVLECDFGTVREPATLERSLARIAGVMESGLFTSRTAAIYKAGPRGAFEVTGAARRGARAPPARRPLGRRRQGRRAQSS